MLTSCTKCHSSCSQTCPGAASVPTLSHQPPLQRDGAGGRMVTANSPSSCLFTRLKCAKSRSCSWGLCREHPNPFQPRARSAVISPSPLWWLRSFSMEANEKKNNQKEKNNPSRCLQSVTGWGNAEAFGNLTRVKVCHGKQVQDMAAGTNGVCGSI